MERNREARRGTMAAMNGGGLSRRRQRSNGLRDSPEDGEGMEIPETSRLRKSASKSNRQRDRSSMSKRKRPERMMHGGGREDGEDSSEESLQEEEQDDHDQGMSHRRPPRPPELSPAPQSLLAQHNTHVRRSFPPAKSSRPPPAIWKVGDEMIGIAVPRKARSASGKRSQDCWVSSGGGEQIHRHASTSPARPSPAYATLVFPSSSNGPVRKKLKPISGTKQRPPNTAKSSSIQEIEIEAAEVLYGLTKQFQSPSKQDTLKLDSKDTNVSIKEAKSRVSSPISSSPATSQPSLPPLPNSISCQGTSAPKKQQPRPVNLDGRSPTNPLSSSALPAASLSFAVKLEPKQPVKPQDSSPRLEQSTASAPIANGGSSLDLAIPPAGGVPLGVQDDSAVKPESNPLSDAKVSTGEADGRDRTEVKGDSVSIVKEAPCSGLDVNPKEPKKGKGDMAAEKRREEKFSIDLMAPPLGKSSPGREDYATDHKPLQTGIELVSKKGDAGQEEKIEAKTLAGEMLLADRKEKPMADEFDLKKRIGNEGPFDLRCDLEKPKREDLGGCKQQVQKQPSKGTIMKSKPEKAVPLAVSTPLPMPLSGWPGNLPPFGYMDQVPSLQAFLPIDGSTGTSKAFFLEKSGITCKALPPPSFLSQARRPKRCATHCYIARNIYHHQHLAKMNPFCPAAAGAVPLYGAKSYDLNVVPPSESTTLLGNPLQGSLPARHPGSSQDKGSGSVAAGYLGHFAAKEKGSADNDSVEAAQRKQQVAHQPGITFIFPLNQHVVAAATQSAAPTSSGTSNAAPAPTATANSGAASSGGGRPVATMNFNYTSLPPNDAQYLTVVLNNGYPFHTPPHVPAPSPYRGASPAQALPFFYSSQMLPPSQLQQQPPPQQPPLAQQGHQNISTSSGSSSSQKQPQQSQRIPGGGAAAAGGTCDNLSVSKQRQHSSETACYDSPHAQKSIYGHIFTMPICSQSSALISPAAAALGTCGGRQHEKQPAAQHPSVNVELAPSQAFAMSFAPLSGAAAATATAIAAAAAAPQGLDSSVMVQNHALFQTLPEAAQQGCQISAAEAPVQAAHQHKKAAHQDVAKPAGELTDAANAGQKESKMMAGTQAPLSSSQHSHTFSGLENEVPACSIPSNSVMDSSSQTMNLIQAATKGGRPANRIAITAPAGSSTTTATASSPNFQLQQQIQLQHQLTCAKSLTSGSNASVYSDRLATASNASKLPQALFGFPQVLIKSGGSSPQSNQWNSSRSASTPAPPSSAPSSSVKSQLPQQQRRVYQQSPPPSADQTRTSFGVNSLKMVVGSTGQGSTPSLASANSMVVGSLQNSVTKSAGVGSPRSPTSTKSVPPVSTALPVLQQGSVNSPLSSSMKPSSVTNRNAPFILGQPHMAPIQSSSSIKQQPSQPPQKQPFPQAQLFFSDMHLPSQYTLSNATAVYYQRQQSEQHSQQPQQQNSAQGSTGVLSLSSALTLAGTPAAADTAKSATTAGGLKGTLPYPAQPAAHTLISVAAAGFPYIHSMPPVSVKPVEQKPAAGN